jgi:hypothetical protein
MSRIVVLLLASVLGSSLGCEDLRNGCGRAGEESPSNASRADLNRRLGLLPAQEDGRWSKFRAPQRIEETALETQIRQLEALGYASGTQTAPSLVGVTVHDKQRAHAGLNFYVSGHAAEAVLMTMDGRVVHRWARDFSDVWPRDDAERTQEGTQHWRHAQPFENGDLLWQSTRVWGWSS